MESWIRGSGSAGFLILVCLEDFPLALTGSRAARQPSIDAVPIGTFADSEARSINARLGSLKAPRCRREAAKLLRSLTQEAAGEDRCLDQLKECYQLCDAVGSLALFANRFSEEPLAPHRPVGSCPLTPAGTGLRLISNVRLLRIADAFRVSGGAAVAVFPGSARRYQANAA